MDLKGSRTEQNLRDAFSGESQARNKYTYYAGVAKKVGYEQIAGYFLETAENEKEHAKMELKFLGGIGDIKQNLQDAIDGEHHEWTVMYPEFEKVAREEGFEAIAGFFNRVATVEKSHEKRYQQLLDNLNSGEVFKRPETVKWVCRNCGYVHEGTEPPETCPVCVHPRAFFEIKCENY